MVSFLRVFLQKYNDVIILRTLARSTNCEASELVVEIKRERFGLVAVCDLKMDETSGATEIFESNPKNRINMGMPAYISLEDVENYLGQRYISCVEWKGLNKETEIQTCQDTEISFRIADECLCFTASPLKTSVSY